MANKIIHKHSLVIENGKAKLPSAEQLDYGELAVNYADGVETITIKNTANEIVEFKSNEYYNKEISNLDGEIDALKTQVGGKASSTHSHGKITLSGDVSGNATIGSGTTAINITTTVADNSHKHTSANISDSVASGVTSGTTALAQGRAIVDYAAPKAHTHVSAGITDSVASGVTSSTTALAQGRAIVDYAAPKTHNHGTITLTGDVTGSGTITGTNEIKITATVANDSHSHSNYTTNTNFNAHTATSGTTGATGHVKLVTGDLSGTTTYTSGQAAAAAHTHGQYANKSNFNTHSGTTGTSGATGHVKLVTGNLNGKKYADGEAAAAAHTHDNYSVTGHKHVSADITDSISASSGITSTASGLTQGKAVYNYAAKKSHASSAPTYGVATTANYGHVKISNDDVSKTASADGLAAGMDHTHSDYATVANLDAATTRITKLEGNDAGKSIRAVATEEVAKVIAEAPESYDTLKEIADWISNDTTGAASMANDITELKGTVSGFTSTSTIKETTNALQTAVNGKAPTSHASTAKTYGVATTANYGHVKISNEIVEDVISADGLAAGMDHSHKKIGTSNVGSSTQPIYLSSGTPTACTYTLGKSVPSSAVFTDTMNTAGSTNSTSKLYLIGAASQGSSTQTYSNNNIWMTDGNLTIKMADNDKFIYWDYDGDGTAGASWRSGVYGSGTANTNYYSIDSGKVAASGTTWNQVLRLGQNDFEASFKGAILPLANNSQNIGSSSLKWKNAYATTFHGSLSGNASSATLASTVTVGTGSGDSYRPIVVHNGSALYSAGDATGKPRYNYSTGDIKAKSFTTDGGVFTGNLTGTASNATTATKLGTSTIGSASKPIYLSSGTPTACTSIDNSFISKTGGTSTLAWNSEVTLATIAGQAIKAKLPANPNTDTKNTAGSTASDSKLFLVGATSQAANPQTYSNANVYATAGKLYCKGLTSTNGDISLYTDSGDTPSLVFHRGTIADSLVDWKMYVTNGILKIQNATNSVNNGAWKDILSFSTNTSANITSAYNITAPKFIGALQGNATSAESATKATQDGSGRTITTTYSTTGHTHSAATTSVSGLMSAADKTKLDGIAAGANKYTLPTATSGVTGGVKVAGTRSSAVTTTQGGTGSTRYYGVEIDSNGKAFVNVPWTDTTPTGSTTTYGVLKIKTGDLSDITSNADSIAASYYHNHDKKYAASGHTHSDASGTSKGFVKLVNSDLQYSTHVNGEAAGLGHTHGQYANQHVVASALTDLDYRIRNVNANAISTSSGITSNATDLVQGKAVQAYAAPKVHTSSTSGTYGAATTSLYGHVKLSNGDVSAVATANGLAAGMDHYHSKTRISTSSTNGYYPMLFVNATKSGDTAILIDSSTGTGSTSNGIRYNPSGNTCYCSGGFFEASDERLKNFGKDIDVDLDKLAQLPKKYFTWKHDKDGKVHIGTSAQELQKIYPELVDTLEDGTLIVSYDTLSVIALKGVDVLYEKYKTLEERLNKIEKMLG